MPFLRQVPYAEYVPYTVCSTELRINLRDPSATVVTERRGDLSDPTFRSGPAAWQLSVTDWQMTVTGLRVSVTCLSSYGDVLFMTVWWQ